MTILYQPKDIYTSITNDVHNKINKDFPFFRETMKPSTEVGGNFKTKATQSFVSTQGN